MWVREKQSKENRVVNRDKTCKKCYEDRRDVGSDWREVKG